MCDELRDVNVDFSQSVASALDVLITETDKLRGNAEAKFSQD